MLKTHENKHSIFALDDLEIVDLKHLQATQDEMMKKLAIMDDENLSSEGVGGGGGDHSENSSASATPKGQKKSENMNSSSKRHRWKNWGWKHSPAKSLSIEEEPNATLLESPKKSHSSKSSTPNQSPKHRFRVNSNETIIKGGEDLSTPFRRRKNKTEAAKTELRSSAGARLIQLYDNNDDDCDRLDSHDEFHAMLPENGRPASIHIIQTIARPDES